jgi:hypothetical protein
VSTIVKGGEISSGKDGFDNSPFISNIKAMSDNDIELYAIYETTSLGKQFLIDTPEFFLPLLLPMPRICEEMFRSLHDNSQTEPSGSSS